MEIWSWLKKFFPPQTAVGARAGDSQLAWTSSSSREDDRDVFDDTYFVASAQTGGNDGAGDAGSSDCSSDSGSSDGGGGDGD